MAFNTESGEWQTLPPCPFEERANHTMTVVDRKLWVIGGATEKDIFGDVHTYDLDSRTWEAILVK